MQERRAFPRYPITFPVEIVFSAREKNLRFDAECVNISRTSIEVSCEQDLVEALLAQAEYPHRGQLDFKMPGDGLIYSIQSQVVTHRRLARTIIIWYWCLMSSV